MDLKYREKYKKYKKKYLIANGGMMPRNIINHCNPEKVDKCIENLWNVESFLQPFNELRTCNIGLYVRDHIGINKIIDQIFVKEFGFNIKILTFTGIANIKDYSGNEFRTFVENFIDKLNSDCVYFVNVAISPTHVNLIYIDQNDKNNKIIYMYEPHQTMNIKLVEIGKIFENKQYTVDYKLGGMQLIQRSLPLCYLYCFHYFLVLFVSRFISHNITSNPIEKSIVAINDDAYIMIFGQNILRLCHRYNLINDLEYYIVTNNSYNTKMILNNRKDYGVLFLFKCVNNKNFEKILYAQYNNTMLGLHYLLYHMYQERTKYRKTLSYYVEMINSLIDHILSRKILLSNDQMHELMFVLIIFVFYKNIKMSKYDDIKQINQIKQYLIKIHPNIMERSFDFNVLDQYNGFLNKYSNDDIILLNKKMAYFFFLEEI